MPAIASLSFCAVSNSPWSSARLGNTWRWPCIEARMLYRSWQKKYTYRGFTLVRDYSCFAYQIAQNSSQHIRALFFERDIKRVTEIAWDQAVNDTANLWQSILWNTFGPVRAPQMYGIPTPVKEIGNGNGSLC